MLANLLNIQDYLNLFQDYLKILGLLSVLGVIFVWHLDVGLSKPKSVVSLLGMILFHLKLLYLGAQISLNFCSNDNIYLSF